MSHRCDQLECRAEASLAMSLLVLRTQLLMVSGIQLLIPSEQSNGMASWRCIEQAGMPCSALVVCACFR